MKDGPFVNNKIDVDFKGGNMATPKGKQVDFNYGPDLKNSKITYDDYRDAVDEKFEEREYLKQEEFIVNHADTLKTFFLEDEKKRFYFKLALSILLTVIIMVRALKTSEIKTTDMIREYQETYVEDNYSNIRGKVVELSREDDKLIAIMEDDNFKETYMVTIPKENYKDISVGTEIEISIKDTIIPQVTLEKIIK